MECQYYLRLQLSQHHQYLKTQRTIDIAEKKESELIIEGRHDPCIVQRAVPVIEAVAAIGILDLIL